MVAMAFSKRSVFGFSVVLLGALVGLGCDSDDSSTGSSGSTGGGGGTDEPVGVQIFDGMGTWVGEEGPAGQFGIQGAFFVLEDSVKDGVAVEDGLEHTDLTPDSFDETTAKPCVSGTVAKVTTADGGECNGAAAAGAADACEWSAQWGGGIGLNLKETGGEDSVQGTVDLTAAGVVGFAFEVSGSVTGTSPVVRFKVTDEPNDGEDFCASIRLGQSNTVMLSDLQHQCWGSSGTLSLDLTKAKQLQWQIVSSQNSAYEVADFCIENISVITE